MKFVNNFSLNVQLVKKRQTRKNISKICWKTINFKRFFLGNKFPQKEKVAFLLKTFTVSGVDRIRNYKNKIVPGFMGLKNGIYNWKI